jgi:hypothetical protein
MGNKLQNNATNDEARRAEQVENLEKHDPHIFLLPRWLCVTDGCVV